MQGAVKTLTKAAVGALIKSDPSALAVAGGAEAIGWLIDRLSGQPKTACDRLLASVVAEVDRLPEHEFGGANAKAAAMANAAALFEAHGLTASEIVALNLDPAGATRALLERGAPMLKAAGEPVAGLVRGKIVPAIYRGLLQDPQHVETLKPAIFQALLAQRDEIRALPGAIGSALRDWLGASLVRDPAWEWQPGMADSALLQAEFSVVPFEPREELLDGAKDWCERPEPLGVRLYVGPGGMGKTRLLMQLCRVLDPSIWRAGFLESRSGPLAEWLAETIFRASGATLIVVDYAENRPDDVEILLRQAIRRGGAIGKVRVALLARGEADWWDRLRRSSALAQALLSGGVTEPAIAVGAIAMDHATRVRCFENALAAFAARLGRAPRALAVKPDLSGEHFGAVLMVHMSALATIEGRSLGTARELHDFMLDREARTWQRCLVGPKLSQLDVDDVLQAMAMIVFAGGAEGLSEARGLISRAPRLQHYPQPTIDDLVRLLARLYPRVDRRLGDEVLRVEPIRPDILGERLIERALVRDPRLLEAVFAR